MRLAVVMLLFAILHPASAQVSDTRAMALDRLLHHDCGSCHGLHLNGGLGPALDAARLEDKSPEAILAIIRDGVPGTPMPPWRGLLSEADMTYLVTVLRSGR